MKPITKRLFILLILFGLITPVFSASKPKTMYVTLNPAQLKAKPATAAKKVGTAEYAAAVIVLETKKAWSYVQLESNGSVTGWIPSSALTSKKIKAKKKAASANADELALAGKGMISTIEKVYAEQYEVNFEVVEYIETLSASQDEAINFAREGQLNDGGAE